MRELWELEQRFWRGGVDTFEKYLTADCLLVTPLPGGILTRTQAVESIRGSSRWTSVDMSEQHVANYDNSVWVLAYRVLAKRDDTAPAYSALCSSTYVATKAGWRLLCHQQTPVSA